MNPREEVVDRMSAAWIMCVDIGGGGASSGLKVALSKPAENVIVK